VVNAERRAPVAPAPAEDRTFDRLLDSNRLDDHLDRLFRAAWALSGSREDAEDLVQETYARVLARPRLLRNEDDLAYLLPLLGAALAPTCIRSARALEGVLSARPGQTLHASGLLCR